MLDCGPHEQEFRELKCQGNLSRPPFCWRRSCRRPLVATPALAQKKGGTLRLYHNDNPPSTSLMEELTIASVMPFAAVFNNLVVFDPAKPHESLETVIPLPPRRVGHGILPTPNSPSSSGRA